MEGSPNSELLDTFCRPLLVSLALLLVELIMEDSTPDRSSRLMEKTAGESGAGP